jgi:hypothetical protein
VSALILGQICEMLSALISGLSRPRMPELACIEDRKGARHRFGWAVFSMVMDRAVQVVPRRRYRNWLAAFLFLALWGLNALVVSVVLDHLHSERPVLVELPAGPFQTSHGTVDVLKCHHYGCDRPATRALPEVVAGVMTTGYRFQEDADLYVYCDLHYPSYSDIHRALVGFLSLIPAFVVLTLVLASVHAVKRRKAARTSYP